MFIVFIHYILQMYGQEGVKRDVAEEYGEKTL